METKVELEQRLAALKAKRRPELTKDEQSEAAAVAKLKTDIEAEYVALRKEENADIKARFAPTKARAFFDFDPDMVHPATIQHGGRTCTLHSRFVVRHATADDMEAFEDAKNAAVAAQNDPSKAGELARAAESTAARIARKCIVYPEPASVGAAQHYLDIEASLWYFGAASMALGDAATNLGGLHVLVKQKSG